MRDRTGIRDSNRRGELCSPADRQYSPDVLRCLRIVSIIIIGLLTFGCVDFFEKNITVEGPITIDGLLKEPGDSLINGIICVRVPAGTFTMGSPVTEAGRYPDEEQRGVTLGKFWIAKYPTTNKQYYGAALPALLAGKENHPVADVTWAQASQFAAMKKGALPTEEQWEMAARGGHAHAASPYYIYSGGKNINDIDKVAWYDANSGGASHPVGQKLPNALGIYDMSGNVFEWTSTKDVGPQTIGDDPLPIPEFNSYVIKGGGWKSPPRECRAAERAQADPIEYDDDVGFRVIFEF